MDKQYCLNKHSFHKQTFGLRCDIDETFSTFFFHNSIDYIIEPSISIDHSEIYQNRMYIEYCEKTSARDNINKVNPFVKLVQKDIYPDINYEILDYILSKYIYIKPESVRQLAIGYDDRTDRGVSRVKVYFDLFTEHNIILELLNLGGTPKESIAFSNKHRLLFCVEMSENGKSRIKTYPSIRKISRAYREKFSKKITRVVYNSDSVFITFNEDGTSILHLCVNACKRGDIEKIGLGDLFCNNNFAVVFDKIIDKYPIRLIALSGDEFQNGNINKVNIYY